MFIDRSDQNHTLSNVPFRPAPSKPPTRREEMTSVASDLYDLPPIYVTDQDYSRLRSLPSTERRATKDTVLRFLTHELDRAIVRPATEVPSDAVTLGSRVIFRADQGEKLKSRALVYGGDHSGIGGTVSVLTALGAALLGVRAGSRMPYRGPDGRLRMVSVEGIAYQPESQERHLRPPHRYWPNPYADPDLRQPHPLRTGLGCRDPRRPAPSGGVPNRGHPRGR